MSTPPTVERKFGLARPANSSESRVSFRASWEFYRHLERELGDQHVLSAFDGESIELMSPSFLHERLKCRSGLLVLALVGILGIPSLCAGSTRWISSDARKGLEADESYYLSPEKIAASSALPLDAPDESFPKPDLTIEIHLCPSQVNRPGIYAALGVPELWWLKQDAFTIECLDAIGRYKAVKSSPLLRISAEDLDHWILSQPLQDDNQFLAEFTAWAKDVF